MIHCREYILAALRVASVRAKLYEVEINSIGVALKGDLIGPEEAMAWVNEIGAAGLVVLEPKRAAP